MDKAGIMEVLQIRRTMEQVMREDPVSPASADDTRKALELLCDETSKHGLTPADVIRPMLCPVVEPKQGCDCSACKLRRGEVDHADPEPASHW
jgi:hypothetical protein